jgi:hypothetical protein
MVQKNEQLETALELLREREKKEAETREKQRDLENWRKQALTKNPRR